MRFFIVFPTLLAEFIIFNTSARTGISPSNSYLFPLRLINSLIFVTWWFGWISSFKTTMIFIVNKFSVTVLGNQPESEFRYAFIDLIQSMIPIIIYMIINTRNGTSPLNTFIIGSTATSLGSFVRYKCAYTNISSSCCRTVVSIIIEIIMVIILILLYSRANLASVNLNVLLIIDLIAFIGFNIIK